jgi:hypothetical protein
VPYLVSSFSEAGGHPHNEDAFGVRAHPADEKALLVALADGMGGQAGGGPAARTAVQVALETASQSPLSELRWESVLSEADRAVERDSEAGYTTLVGLQIQEDQVVGASQGDSAVWFRDGAGHSGELTNHQNRGAPVGSGEARFVPFVVTLTPPWTVLVLSDGVWKYVGWGPIKLAAERLRGEELIQELASQARLPRSGHFPDDFTVVAIHAEGEPS